jgi:hypothetical protein
MVHRRHFRASFAAATTALRRAAWRRHAGTGARSSRSGARAVRRCCSGASTHAVSAAVAMTDFLASLGGVKTLRTEAVKDVVCGLARFGTGSSQVRCDDGWRRVAILPGMRSFPAAQKLMTAVSISCRSVRAMQQ